MGWAIVTMEKDKRRFKLGRLLALYSPRKQQHKASLVAMASTGSPAGRNGRRVKSPIVCFLVT
jgi:hypothetical protein